MSGRAGAGRPNSASSAPFPVASQPDALAVMTDDGKVRAYGLFCSGVAGMARTAEPGHRQQPVLPDAPADDPSLDDKYTAWGRVVAGPGRGARHRRGRAADESRHHDEGARGLGHARGRAPQRSLLDPASAAFQARVTAAKASKGAAFTPCDVDIVTRAS